MKKHLPVVVAMALLLAVTGCSSRTAKDESARTAAGAAAANAAPAATDVPAAGGGGEAAADGDRVVVYFAFDSHQITGEAKAALRSLATQLQGGKAALRLEGHADERGTPEYNIALGERRADAVRRFLKAQGVEGQLRVVSFGEEKPAAMGHDESSWALNRRVEVSSAGN